MSNPIMKYYKQYRVLSEIDSSTNNFPKDWSPKNTGNIEESNCDNDIYIKCSKGGKIQYIGRMKFEFYCPSKIRTKNIAAKIKELKPDITFEEHYSDVEGWIDFNPKDIEELEEIFEISSFGAGRSPFSSKNLPKSQYTIPDEDLAKYKEATKDLEMIELAQVARKVNSEIDKKYGKQMRLDGLSAKEYMHKIGKWDKYVSMIKKGITNENNN